jgi:hypothetical protein
MLQSESDGAFVADHRSNAPFTCWPHYRIGSSLGGSILMMSALGSASNRAQDGAATKWPILIILCLDEIFSDTSLRIFASPAADAVPYCLFCALNMGHQQQDGPFLYQQGRLRVRRQGPCSCVRSLISSRTAAGRFSGSRTHSIEGLSAHSSSSGRMAMRMFPV